MEYTFASSIIAYVSSKDWSKVQSGNF